ncbi:hypothetical protein B0H10DRAFT_2340382 [Mycena sp. CBHHK59/15]|nr:hypothetical protein B0H10DRAFT_2340382 [Mycena sp. CBHHK59/15]
MYGLANMTLFLILVNFIAALVSVQFLRGDLSASETMNFGQLFTAFLAVYQVFSSENWTDVLYSTADAEIVLGRPLFSVIFFSAWMLFANCASPLPFVLQMFIAVINENFDVAEEAKKGKQASNYWRRTAAGGPRHWLRRLNPYRWIRASPSSVPRADVQPNEVAIHYAYTGPRHYSNKSLTALQRLFAGEVKSNDVPLTTLHHARNETLGGGHAQDEETERHFEVTTTSEDINDALYERRAQKADFIRDHPSYDKTFWIFSQKNILRRTCQKMVQPASGPRIFGTPHSPVLHPLFQLTLLLIVIGGIVVESIATPVYRRNYFREHGLVRGAWFDIAESAFGLAFFAEFLIKIIADGFLFTPNAYVRSIWNVLDLVIMGGLLINVTTGLIFVGGLSRLTRSLKALRALRLITLIDRMRTTFESHHLRRHAHYRRGHPRCAVHDPMNECNDTSVAGAETCTNEYNTVYGNAFGFLAPRVWDNPAPSTVFSFDSFRASLLILFEIVSLEGWHHGREQPAPDERCPDQRYILPNLQSPWGRCDPDPLREYHHRELQFQDRLGVPHGAAARVDRLAEALQAPATMKRPRTRPKWSVRAWCYDRAVYKNGWWSRCMTLLFIAHIIILMTQFSTQTVADELRNDFFLASTSAYVIDVLVRLFGLGWRSFRSNGWNVFDILVAGGSFVTTLIVRFGTIGFATQQLQKLFLVCIAFKLVERTDSLNKLFKTAVASLPVILSLLGLWFILFLFFGILFLEVFALTKWNSAETRSQNFSTMGSSLVMLTFMSTGAEGFSFIYLISTARGGISICMITPLCILAVQTTIRRRTPTVAALDGLSPLHLLEPSQHVHLREHVYWCGGRKLSYVFQTSSSSKSITRAEIRSFKKVWAEFANPKTGYLERSRFVPFFAAQCKPSTESEYARPGRIVDGVDLNKLEKILKGIDYTSIRKRRAVYSRLYHEASISQHGRGISFMDMLLLLAHHKLIVDRDALILKDLVLRTETNKLVTDLVNLDRVRSLLKTISHRRRFLRYKQEQLMKSEPDIPSIVVDVLPATPPIQPRTSRPPDTQRPAARRRSGSSRPMCPSRRAHRGCSVAAGGRVTSVCCRRHGLPVARVVHQILTSMQNSIWGDLMLEAAEEEEKR